MNGIPSRSRSPVLVTEGVVPSLDPGRLIKCIFKIRLSLVEFNKVHGPEHRFYQLDLACKLTKKPTHIFRDLKRAGENLSLCYSGIPRCNYDNAGIPGPFPKGMVFVVFVTKDRFIVDWRVEEADKEDPTKPVNHRRRFGNLIYSKA